MSRARSALWDLPSRKISPVRGLSRPARQLRSVDFPDPFHDEQMQEVMERLKKVRSERNVRLLKERLISS